MATFPPIDFALAIAKPIVRPTIRPEIINTKQKYGQPGKTSGTNKCTKKAKLLIVILFLVLF